MDSETRDDLSEISTLWPDIRNAHGAQEESVVRGAQEKTLLRYQKAILRYVQHQVRDVHDADDLFQRFAERFLKGDFRHANPDRGRFRDYLKSALFHLVRDHHRSRMRQPVSMPANGPEPYVEDTSVTDRDQDRFLEYWVQELVHRASEALEDHQRRTGQPLAAILRYREEHPNCRSADIAVHFSARLGRNLTPEWARKMLMQARQIFQECLVTEVERSLNQPHPTLSQIEEELIDLRLHSYCRHAIQKRRGA